MPSFWGEKYYTSLYEKIKHELKDKPASELIKIIRERVCDKNGKMPFAISKELWRILEKCNVPLNIFAYGKIKDEELRYCFAEMFGEEVLKKIDRLPKEALIEIIAEYEVLRRRPRDFNLKRWWKSFWHGRRKGRAYPSGWT